MAGNRKDTDDVRGLDIPVFRYILEVDSNIIGFDIWNVRVSKKQTLFWSAVELLTIP